MPSGCKRYEADYIAHVLEKDVGVCGISWSKMVPPCSARLSSIFARCKGGVCRHMLPAEHAIPAFQNQFRSLDGLPRLERHVLCDYQNVRSRLTTEIREKSHHNLVGDIVEANLLRLSPKFQLIACCTSAPHGTRHAKFYILGPQMEVSEHIYIHTLIDTTYKPTTIFSDGARTLRFVDKHMRWEIRFRKNECRPSTSSCGVEIVLRKRKWPLRRRRPSWVKGSFLCWLIEQARQVTHSNGEPDSPPRPSHSRPAGSRIFYVNMQLENLLPSRLISF